MRQLRCHRIKKFNLEVLLDDCTLCAECAQTWEAIGKEAFLSNFTDISRYSTRSVTQQESALQPHKTSRFISVLRNITLFLVHYQKLTAPSASQQLTNGLCCSGNCCILYEQYNIVNSVRVDDWTADFSFISKETNSGDLQFG